MKRFGISIFLCGLVVALGVAATKAGAFWRGAQLQAKEGAEKASSRLTAVKVQPVTAGPLEDRLVLTGTVEPWESITLSAEATGKIERQDIDEGDGVRAGQELVRIDTSLLRAQIDQAQAQERLASQELRRAESLSTKGIATAQAMDKAKADRDMAAASLRLLQIQVEKSVLSAPLDGVVDKVFSELNEFVTVGMPLVRIVQAHKVKVHVGIPEREVGAFSVGDPARVVLDAHPDKEFVGAICLLGPAADKETLTFHCDIALDNPDNVIRPGMIGRAFLVRKRYEDAVCVPLFSILSVESQRFVFVEEDGKARMRLIEPGVIQGSQVQVLSGLSAGDRLVVAGQRDLKDGDAVSVLEAANP